MGLPEVEFSVSVDINACIHKYVIQKASNWTELRADILSGMAKDGL